MVWAFAVLRLFYGQGSGEHDTFMMAAAIVRGVQSGHPINQFCYGEQLQYLFYYVFVELARRFATTTDNVLLLMNAVGAASALAVPLLMIRVLARLLGDVARAELSVLLLVSSPLYLFTASYGHPFMISLPWLLLAWMALLGAADEHTRLGAAAYYVVALILHSFALMLRFEQIALLSGFHFALLAFRERRRPGVVLPCAAVLGASGVLFVVARSLLLSGTPAHAAQASSSAGTIIVLMRTLNPALLKWGLTHVFVGVGPVLLTLAGLALALCLRSRRYQSAVFLVSGIAPSLLVYLGNPSPPRHFYVLTVGLSCLVAATLSPSAVDRLQRSVAVVLACNLMAPWSLILVDGQDYPRRANVTFTVIQRTDRNRAEIAAGATFYPQLIEEARHGPVVVLGSWVHIAQLSAMLANDPRSQLTHAMVAGGVPALELRKEEVLLYLVETYDRDYAIRAVEKVRAGSIGVRCISLVEGATEINDLKLTVPASLLWWNA